MNLSTSSGVGLPGRQDHRWPYRRTTLLLASLATLGLIPSLAALSPAGAVLALLDTLRLNDPQNGYEPWGIAAGPGDGRVYVSCLYGPRHLMVLDAATGSVLGGVPLTGPYPHGICVSRYGPRAYVASTGTETGTVSIIDTHSLEETNAIWLEGIPIALCLLEPPGPTTSRLYVADMNGARVYVLNPETGQVMGTVGVGNTPYDICANPLTNRVYVANLSGGTVSVIDAPADTVLATVPVGAFPEGIAADAELNLVYVTNRDDGTVSVIDGTTNTVIAVYPVGQSPRKVAVDPASHLVYVVNSGDRDLSVLDSHGPIARAGPLGLIPMGGIAVEPAVGSVFVTNSYSDDLTVIRTFGPPQPTTIRLRFDPGSVALDGPLPVGPPHLYAVLVANQRGDDIQWRDPHLGYPPRRLVCGYAPSDIATRPSDGLIAATLAEEDLLVLLRPETGDVRDSIPVGDAPWGVCLRRDRPLAYAANAGSCNLSVVDVDSGTVVKTVEFGQAAWDVAVNEVTDRVYVTTRFALIWVLDGTSHAVLDTISVPVWWVDQIAVDETRNLIYVTCSEHPWTLWVVDGATNEIVTSVAMPDVPLGVAVNEGRERTYVSTLSSVLAVGPAHTIEDELLLPGDVFRCAADPWSNWVLVSALDEGGGLLYVVLDGDPTGVRGEPGDSDVSAGGSSSPALAAPAKLRLSLAGAHPVHVAGGGGGCASREGVALVLETPGARELSLRVYDARGRLVRDLLGGGGASFGPGTREIIWDARDGAGQAVAPGVYTVLAREGGRHGEGEAAVLRVVVVR